MMCKVILYLVNRWLFTDLYKLKDRKTMNASAARL